MNKLSLKELFESQVENIWNNPKYSGIDIRKFSYAQQDNQEKNALLFIGINPSNSKNNIEKVFYNNEEEGAHKYFKRFIEISKFTDIPWSHIDLLFVRETKQSNIKELLYSKDEITLDFFQEQLELSKQILEKINPKIIVVNNTLARDSLGGQGGRLGYNFKFDENLGTYIIVNNNSNLNGTPVFFTSMLTGQRALDNGSYKRLIWHINFVKSKIEK